MKRIAWQSFVGLASRMPWPLLRDAAGPGALPGVFYHLVADQPPPHIAHLYTVRPPALFREDLATFSSHFKPVGFDDVLDLARQGNPWPTDQLMISFDDGLREAYEIAAPLLEAAGIPAVFYVCPPVLDNRDMLFRHKVSLLCDLLVTGQASPEVVRKTLCECGYTEDREPRQLLLRLPCRSAAVADAVADAIGYCWADYLAGQRPYMSWSELEDLRARGFGVGAHTLCHPPFSEIEWPEQQRETEESVAAVASWLGGEPVSFAFPFMDTGTDPRWFSHFLDSGRIPFSVGTSGFVRDAHPLHLQRLVMDNSLAPAERMLRSACAARLFRRLIRKDRIEHHGA